MHVADVVHLRHAKQLTWLTVARLMNCVKSSAERRLRNEQATEQMLSALTSEQTYRRPHDAVSIRNFSEIADLLAESKP
jgi:hypothetical protein